MILFSNQSFFQGVAFQLSYTESERTIYQSKYDREYHSDIMYIINKVGTGLILKSPESRTSLYKSVIKLKRTLDQFQSLKVQHVRGG